MDSTPRSSDAEQQSAPNTKNILWKKKIFDAQKIFAAKQKYSQVLTDWAAAVWEDDAVGLCVVCLGGGGLELDPVWHGGQELLGQGQHTLVLLGLLLSRAASCSNTNDDLLASALIQKRVESSYYLFTFVLGGV